MAVPIKDGKMWRHRFMLGGVRKSGTFPTKAAALAWEAAERSTPDSPALVDKTCGDAFAQYKRDVSKSKRGHRWEALRLDLLSQSKLASVPIAKVTSQDIAAWRDARLEAVSNSTVLREMKLLSHVFTIARKEWKWLTVSPTRDVARPKEAAARDRPITQLEIDTMCLALGFTDGPVTKKCQIVAVAFLFALETAMRSGEILALRREWITGAVAHLPAHIVKNGIRRDVPLSKRALELLTFLPAGELMFDISAGIRDALFRKARDKTVIKNLHFHDTRHEAVTRLAKKLHVLDLARMTGHTDLKELQTYYNAKAADIAHLLG